GFELVCDADGRDAAALIEPRLIFRQVEIERTAFLARDGNRLVGVPERAEHGLQNGAGLVVWRAVDGLLHLAIAQPRRRAHEAADEFMTALVAVRIEDHAHGEAGAIFL